MKHLRWDPKKSSWLKLERGVTFEEIIEAPLIGVKTHPRRPDQDIMLFEFKNQVWIVPFVREEDIIFLKTLFPSRKYTKKYRKGKLNEEI